jgi:WD40 repeat protein
LAEIEFYLRHSIDEDGSALYRLYHQELVTFLAQSMAAGTVLDALLSTVRTANGRLRWDLAHPYLLRHIAAHAAEAGRAEELITDPEFMVYADAAAILDNLGQATTSDATVAAAVFRTSMWRPEARDSVVRREMLSIDAARFNQPELSNALALGDGARANAWLPVWATGAQVSEALTGILSGHTGAVTTVCVGEVARRKVVVSGSTDHTIRIWDLATGRLLGKPLKGHNGPVRALCLAEVDGSPVVVSAGDDATVRLWDAETGSHLMTLTGHRGPVNALSVAERNGRLVVATVGADGTVRLWDPGRGAPVTLLRARGTTAVTAVTLVPRPCSPGQPPSLIAVTAHRDRTWQWWDLEHHVPYTWNDAPAASDTQVATVAAAIVNGRQACVTGSTDGVVAVWDVADGQPTITLRIPSPARIPVTSVAVVAPTAAASFIVAAMGKEVAVHRFGHVVEEPVILPGHDERVTSVSAGTMSGQVVAASGGQDGTVRTWRLSAGHRHSRPLPGHTHDVTAMALVMKDGTAAVASAALGAVWLRALDDGRELGRLSTGHGLLTACAAAEISGRPALLTAGNDGLARLWDVGTHQAVLPPLMGHSGWVNAVAIGHIGDAPVAVTGSSDRTARLWDLTTGQQICAPLIHHSAAIRAVAISRLSDRTIVATGGEDRVVALWDVTDSARPSLLRATSGHMGAVNSVLLVAADDGLLAVSGSADSTIRLWDAAEGDAVGQPLKHHLGAVTAICTGWLDDRRVLVSASRDTRVCAWDITHRQSVAVFHLPRAAGHIACSEDGDLLVAFGRDIAALRQPLRVAPGRGQRSRGHSHRPGNSTAP